MGRLLHIENIRKIDVLIGLGAQCILLPALFFILEFSHIWLGAVLCHISKEQIHVHGIFITIPRLSVMSFIFFNHIFQCF